MAKKATQAPIALTPEQIREFKLNRLNYYCKVREAWNNQRKKKDYSFDIIRYQDGEEIMMHKGTKIFPISENEAIKKRNEIIEYYLNKLTSQK